MFFKKNILHDKSERLYEIFLDNIDDLSQTRLRGYDISFNNLKKQMYDDGLNLSELECSGDDVSIKRNNKGFYLACKSDKGIKIFNKYKEDFEKIHLFLLDKEEIMKGSYKCNKRNIDDLKAISCELGYGETRDKLLNKK